MPEFSLALLEWPAMALTLISTWLVATETAWKKILAFICFMLSNALWVLWGWHTQAYALILMQVGLLFLNLRGIRKTHAQQHKALEHAESTHE